jgi:hypothetical protein
MADLTTEQRAPLIVTDSEGVHVPIIPFSISLSGEAGVVSLSQLYGNGQLDVIAQAPGIASIDVTIPGFAPASLTVTVIEAEGEEPGTLILVLGAPVPK